jgi:hypothetical protein
MVQLTGTKGGTSKDTAKSGESPLTSQVSRVGSGNDKVGAGGEAIVGKYEPLVAPSNSSSSNSLGKG